MTKRLKFSEGDKNFIEWQIVNKTMTVTELAHHFAKHPKTINRVMTERGINAPPTCNRDTTNTIVLPNLDVCKVLGVLAKHGIAPESLDAILSARASVAFTPERVQTYLDNCDTQELNMHLRAITQKAVANTAALFRPVSIMQNTDAAAPSFT